MRTPFEVKAKLAELGQQVLDEDASELDLAEQLAEWVLKKQPAFANTLVVDWSRATLRSWVHTQARKALGHDDETDGVQMVIPFPELGPKIEVGIGILKHQSVMTAHDWDMALEIYRNRRNQAEIAFRNIERAHHRVVPLLGEGMTTADVLDQLLAAD